LSQNKTKTLSPTPKQNKTHQEKKKKRTGRYKGVESREQGFQYTGSQSMVSSMNIIWKFVNK
jgi:hypothetical protein